MDVQQCISNGAVQAGVIGSSDPAVQDMIMAGAVVQTLISKANTCLAGLGQYEAAIALYQEGLAECQAGIETLYGIDAQVGGASIIIGLAWPAVAVGLFVSAWRLYAKPSLRAALLVFIMVFTAADVSVISWARSNDLRYVYQQHTWTYARLLVTFSISRSAVLLIASSLRYQIVLVDARYSRALVIASVVIGIGSAAGEYITAFKDFADTDATRVSAAFWYWTAVNPVTYIVFGLATFTLTLHSNRMPGIPDKSEAARQMRNLEVINNGLIFVSCCMCVLVITVAFATDPDTSYYTIPVQVCACAYWSVGENLFEVLALFKTSAESATASREPSGVTDFVAFSKMEAPGARFAGAKDPRETC
ncbi:hypothetical protein HKX48_009425 [Thoreauomyces humboldtii]|nr:hypothetical protein HKX48_009425 [Thoreauomyces humboldtii]